MPAKKQKAPAIDPSKELPAGYEMELANKGKIGTNEHFFYPNDVKTFLAWAGPGRPFRKRGRQFYLTALLIFLLVEIILFLFSQYLLMFVVVSLLFLGFVLAAVPPKDFHYKITNQGITVEDHSYLWEELYDFYFRKMYDTDVLHIGTKAFIPGELTITLGDITRDQIRNVLLPYLPYRETIRQSFMEKSADWLSRNFPLEPSH